MNTTTAGQSNEPRRGRGKSKASLDLVDAAVKFYELNHPASVRAACYHLFIKKLISAMSTGNTSAVSKLLTWAREQGLLPWEHVVDETREAETIASWTNPEAIIRSAVNQYRKNYWQDQPRWIEVWSEKGTVRGTLAPVLKEYGLTFRVMHGYASATALHGIAAETTESDKPLTILYCGDWDPSGLHMSEIDLPRRLERYDGEATIKRIALTAGDVSAGTELPSFEVESKHKDPRYKWFTERYGRRCWELDALAPIVLRNRVEAEIRALLDHDAWNHAKEIEAAEVKSMSGFLDTWKSICSPVSKYSGPA